MSLSKIFSILIPVGPVFLSLIFLTVVESHWECALPNREVQQWKVLTGYVASVRAPTGRVPAISKGVLLLIGYNFQVAVIFKQLL